MYSSYREAEFLDSVDRCLSDAKAVRSFLKTAAPMSKIKRFDPVLQEVEDHLNSLRENCIKNLRG